MTDNTNNNQDPNSQVENLQNSNLLDETTTEAIRSLLKAEIPSIIQSTLKQNSPLNEFRNQVNGSLKTNTSNNSNNQGLEKDYISDYNNAKQQEQNEVDYYNKKEQVYNESKALLETARKFGELGNNIADKMENDYYSKHIYSPKINNLFKEHVIRMINEDANLHNLIPKSKISSLQAFNEEVNAEKRLEKANEIFDVVNIVIDLKEQQEEQEARNRANKTFVNARGDVMHSRFSVANEEFFKPKS